MVLLQSRPASVPGALVSGGRRVDLGRPWLWLAAALVLAGVRLPGFQLWGDVRFTLGVERATARTGWTSSEIWAHRPMLNRQLMAALDHVTAGPFREQQLLLWAAALAGLVVWALYRSLRPRLGPLESVGLCGGLLVALLWTSSRTLLQPEWFALLAALGAIAAGARPPADRRLVEWAGWVGAGLLFAATVLMKWTTVGTAAAAWVVVVTLLWRERRRLIGVTVAAAVLTPLVLALQILAVPHEGLWLTEIPHLNPDPASLRWCSPWHAPTPSCPLQDLLANEWVISPAWLMLPPSVVLLARSSSGLRRVCAVAVPALGVATALATTIAQGQWFAYHLAAVPVLGGAWLGWALTRWVGRTGRAPVSLVLPALLAAPVLAGLLSMPERLRTTRRIWGEVSPADVAFALALAIGLLALVLAATCSTGARTSAGPASQARRRSVAVGALCVGAVLATFVNPVLPTTAYSFDFTATDKTWFEEQAKAERFTEIADRIHARIGTDVPVVYLSFGEMTYWVGNPTYCRYAAATFLQRSRWVPTSHLRSFAENLACLDDQRARFVVIEKGWLALGKSDPILRRELDRRFDCARPVVEVRGAEVCACRA